MMHTVKWKSSVITITLCFIISGCAALPFVLPPLIEFAGGMIKTAMNNYNKSYNNDLQSLMMSVQQGQGNSLPQGYANDQGQEYSQNPYGGDSNADGQEFSYQNDQGQGFSQNPYDEYSNTDDQGFSYQNDQEQNLSENVNDQYTQQPFDNTQYENQGVYQEDESYPQSQEGYEAETNDQSTEQPNSISLDVLLVKKTIRNGAVTLMPIRDGDVLRDGRGNAQAGDKFRIMFRANTNCYVYVISIDGSAWAQGVFPPPGNPFANPVIAGKQYVIPENDNWFSLDQFKGIETIFFVASGEKRDDIETIMTRIAGHERKPSDTPQQVTEAPIIPQGFAGARRSQSPFAIQTGLQQGQQLLPTTFFAKTAGEALRVTRWFRHQ